MIRRIAGNDEPGAPQEHKEPRCDRGKCLFGVEPVLGHRECLLVWRRRSHHPTVWGDFDEDQLANVGVWTRPRVPLILRIKHLEHIGWGLFMKCGVADRNRISIPVTLGWHPD